ncbi:MAG: helix-turn-helix transcriptional regulator [Dehalococcoidia bacterium]
MAKRGRPRHPDILTPREWEVLALLRAGLTNDQIAVRLEITERTARYHVSEILSKLGVSTRQEAASWESEERRSWWALIGAPLAGLRQAALGWAPAALVGGVVMAIGVGVGALVWGLARTDGDGADRYAASVPVALPTQVVDAPGELVWEGGAGTIRIVSANEASCGDRATAGEYDLPIALDSANWPLGRTMLGLEAVPYDYVPAQVQSPAPWEESPAGWRLSLRQNPLAKSFGMARYPSYAEYFLRRRDLPDLLFRYGADVCDPSLIDAEQLRRRTFTISEELPRIVMHRQGDYISPLEAIASALRAQPEGARPVWLELGNSADFAASRGDMRFPQLNANPEAVLWEVMFTLGDEAGPRRPGQELAAFSRVDAVTGARSSWGCCFHVILPRGQVTRILDVPPVSSTFPNARIRFAPTTTKGGGAHPWFMAQSKGLS